MINIAKIDTWNSGGNCMVDMIYLNDGRVIGLNEECVVLYPSENALFDDNETEFPCIITDHVDFNQDSYEELSTLPYDQRLGDFVVCTWSEYPDLDMLLLDDGRILGIDSATICLYSDYQQWERHLETNAEAFASMVL